MSNIHVLGIDFSKVGTFEKAGGSTRVKGLEDTRRRDKMPMRLLLDDLPVTVGAEEGRLCAALSGTTGVDGTSALRFKSLAGVIMGRLIALGVERVFVRAKCDALFGFTLFLNFLLDDREWKGRCSSNRDPRILDFQRPVHGFQMAILLYTVCPRPRLSTVGYPFLYRLSPPEAIHGPIWIHRYPRFEGIHPRLNLIHPG